MWKLVDFGILKGTMADRFVAADRYETTIVIKDISGNLLLDGQIENVRTDK